MSDSVNQTTTIGLLIPTEIYLENTDKIYEKSEKHHKLIDDDYITQLVRTAFYNKNNVFGNNLTKTSIIVSYVEFINENWKEYKLKINYNIYETKFNNDYLNTDNFGKYAVNLFKLYSIFDNPTNLHSIINMNKILKPLVYISVNDKLDSSKNIFLSNANVKNDNSFDVSILGADNKQKIDDKINEYNKSYKYKKTYFITFNFNTITCGYNYPMKCLICANDIKQVEIVNTVYTYFNEKYPDKYYNYEIVEYTPTAAYTTKIIKFPIMNINNDHLNHYIGNDLCDDNKINDDNLNHCDNNDLSNDKNATPCDIEKFIFQIEEIKNQIKLLKQDN